MGLVGLELTGNIHAAFMTYEKETKHTSLSTIFKYLTFFPSSIMVDTANPLTKVDFVVRFQVSLLVEASATDGAAVGFLSCVDQLVPLQLVGVGEFLAAHGAVVPDLLFGLF